MSDLHNIRIAMIALDGFGRSELTGTRKALENAGARVDVISAIRGDVRNAGAHWEDSECVVDQNLVTSRGPHDLPAFNREMIRLSARVPAEARR